MTYTHEEVAEIAQKYGAIQRLVDVTSPMDLESARLYADSVRKRLNDFKDSIPSGLQEILMEPLERGFKGFVKHYIANSPEQKGE